jgi:hypothetical protein
LKEISKVKNSKSLDHLTRILHRTSTFVCLKGIKSVSTVDRRVESHSFWWIAKSIQLDFKNSVKVLKMACIVSVSV